MMSIFHHSGNITTKTEPSQENELILKLLRFDLWMMILATTVVIALIKSSLLLKFSKLKFINILGFLWYTFTAYFGGKPAGTAIDSRRTYKAVVFTSLLGGVVVWIAYRSFLTAELAVVIKKYPFTDFESLSKTDWRYFS